MSLLMLIIVLIVICTIFGTYVSNNYGDTTSAVDRFMEDYPFLGFIYGGSIFR